MKKWPDDFLDKIICYDCLKVMRHIPDGVIDLIVTDPPYGINKGKIIGDEDLTLWKKSLLDSHRILKSNSFYCLFASIEMLPEVLIEVTKFFTYRWQTIFYINNGMVRGSMGFSVYYPCLIFMKGKAKIKHQLKDVYETSTSSKEMKQRVHPYQKDLGFISKIIDTCSNENDIVLDSFIGSGTVAVAANKLNRHFIGIDISKEYCEIARQRILDVPNMERS